MKYRATGPAYGRGPSGDGMVALTCPTCEMTIMVDLKWRIAHIGETKWCWHCGGWFDIPVLASWERT